MEKPYNTLPNPEKEPYLTVASTHGSYLSTSTPTVFHWQQTTKRRTPCIRMHFNNKNHLHSELSRYISCVFSIQTLSNHAYKHKHPPKSHCLLNYVEHIKHAVDIVFGNSRTSKCIEMESESHAAHACAYRKRW